MKTNKPETINQHENKYWHIPKFAILPLAGLIIFGLLAWGNLYLINWQEIKVAYECTKDNCSLTASALINIYPMIGEYLLICLSLVSLIASIKKGYKNLKSYNEEGLIVGLIGGLIEEFEK